MKIVFERTGRGKKRRTLAEFSKRVVAALIAVWFAGALLGAAVVAVTGRPCAAT